MSTTRKPRSTGYEAGQQRRSKTLKPRKAPEKLGPGLRELEQLVGKAKVKEAKEAAKAADYGRAFALSINLERNEKKLKQMKKERKDAAIDLAMKAISNPRPLPRRKQQVYAPTANYRVVRRSLGKGEYLVIAVVEYLNGKPYRFDTVGGPPSTELKPLPGVRILDAEGIQRLRGKLDEMLTAFAQPILDERDDFGRK